MYKCVLCKADSDVFYSKINGYVVDGPKYGICLCGSCFNRVNSIYSQCFLTEYKRATFSMCAALVKRGGTKFKKGKRYYL